MSLSQDRTPMLASMRTGMRLACSVAIVLTMHLHSVHGASASSDLPLDPILAAPHSSRLPEGIPMSSHFVTPLWHILRAADASLGLQSATDLFVPKPVPTAPPCGMGACDDPASVDLWLARVAEKRATADTAITTMRARVFLLAEDDGSNPVLSPDQIDAQFALINSSLESQLGWAFTYDIQLMKDSIARARVVVPFCSPSDIGTGTPCTGSKSMCNMSITGYAGGDCLSLPDDPACAGVTGNGVCDAQCNYAKFGYDGGDCCLAPVAATMCREPTNPLRAWITQDDYRRMPLAHGLSPDAQHFSIYPVVYPPGKECPFCGASTTGAWDYNSTDILAQGSLYSIDSFQGAASPLGGGSIPLHEVGHTFGLLHTFRGMEVLVMHPEIPPCAWASQVDHCADVVQYDVTSPQGQLTGDLSMDTRVSPMYMNKGFACGAQPAGADCESTPWTGVPVQNFMGFNYFSCSPAELSFTPVQIAKMHCALAEHYSDWIVPAPEPSGGGSTHPGHKLSTLAKVGLGVGGFVVLATLLWVAWRSCAKKETAQEQHYHLQE